MTPITSRNEDENCYFDDEQGRGSWHEIIDGSKSTKQSLILVQSQKTQPGLNGCGETQKINLLGNINIWFKYLQHLFLANIDFDTDRDHQRNMLI